MYHHAHLFDIWARYFIPFLEHSVRQWMSQLLVAGTRTRSKMINAHLRAGEPLISPSVESLEHFVFYDTPQL